MTQIILPEFDVRIEHGLTLERKPIWLSNPRDSQESRDADRRDKWANERGERVVIVNDGFWPITEDVEGYR